MPEEPKIINIKYGQVGAQSGKVRLKQAFQVRTDLPGDLTIEFVGDSPLAGDKKKMKAGEGNNLVAERIGTFRFDCFVEKDGHTTKLSSGGGELEVAC